MRNLATGMPLVVVVALLSTACQLAAPGLPGSGESQTSLGARPGSAAAAGAVANGGATLANDGAGTAASGGVDGASGVAGAVTTSGVDPKVFKAQRLEGNLIDSQTMPIAGAVIEWGDERAVTDAQGHYKFEKPGASEVVMAFVPGHAPVIQRVVSEAINLVSPKLSHPAMAISAATGGVYVSPDGALTAKIPPGALDRDANVRFTPVAGDAGAGAMRASDDIIPGITFQADLGAASLRPDTAITVTQRVGEEQVKAMRERIPGFSLERFNMAVDAEGHVTMTMPIRGPGSKSPENPGAAPDEAWFLSEFGGLPLPESVVKAPPPTYAVLYTRADFDHPDEYTTLRDGRTIRLPRTVAEWGSMERARVFSCAALNHCWHKRLGVRNKFQKERDDLVTTIVGNWNKLAQEKDQLAAYQENAGPANADEREALRAVIDGREQTINRARARVAEIDRLEETIACSIVDREDAPVDVPTRTTWISDDPALQGKPAAGVNVRFTMPSNPVAGTHDTLTDALGVAMAFAPVGTPIGITPFLADPGPSTGATVNVTASEAMPSVALSVVKNSPLVRFNFEADGNLVANSAEITFTLDGALRTTTLLLSAAGENKAKGEAYVRVADDGFHAFQVSKVAVESYAANKVLPSDAVRLRRNGAYDFTISLFATSPK